MLDPKFIKDNLVAITTAAKNKNIVFDADKYSSVYDRRLQLIEQTEELRRKRNEGSDKVKKGISATEREDLINQVRSINLELSNLEQQLTQIENDFQSLLLSVPSIPSDDTPLGKSDAENVEIKQVGTIRNFDFPTLDHIELGKKLGLVDFERGAAVAGSRSYFLIGAAAELERAVHSLALDLLRERGYTQLSVPVLVRSQAMEGTGYLPAGRDQAYFVEKDDMWLVGTSEVPLASYYSDRIFSESELPVKVCAWSTCFRREAGAHGKDTKGLYRVHQFQKIEQVVICPPDKSISDALHAELLDNAESLMQLLELPYRVVQVCTGDLGQGQVRKHDIEAWMPSRKNWGETHSCSSFYDFQARRLKIRMKDNQGKNVFCYTLNNTAIATPRVLIPLLENNQTADGRIVIPKVLRKYMNGKEIIG